MYYVHWLDLKQKMYSPRSMQSPDIAYLFLDFFFFFSGSFNHCPINPTPKYIGDYFRLYTKYRPFAYICFWLLFHNSNGKSTIPSVLRISLIRSNWCAGNCYYFTLSQTIIFIVLSLLCINDNFHSMCEHVVWWCPKWLLFECNEAEAIAHPKHYYHFI